MAGRAAGNINFWSLVILLAWWRVNRSCAPCSAECRPKSVFTMIGNREIITQTTIREVGPVPNQKEMSGTMARMGMAWRVTM
jgi:hypothetical protein